MIELIRHLATPLVDNPEGIKLNEIEGENSNVIELQVDKPDVGKVIGRKGKIADAFRTLLNCAGKKREKNYILQILD